QLGVKARYRRYVDLHIAAWRAADCGLAMPEGIPFLARPVLAPSGDEKAGRREIHRIVRQCTGLRNGETGRAASSGADSSLPRAQPQRLFAPILALPGFRLACRCGRLVVRPCPRL